MGSDRFSLVLLLLDGLADWPARELGGSTPLEAAATPHLDRLAREGASGLVYPLAPGLAPSSDTAQWNMLGYAALPSPGRAVLEALGAGVEVPDGVVVTYAALRSAERCNGRLELRGWYREAEDEECRPLLESLNGVRVRGIQFEMRYLERGDALLLLHGDASPWVTDSDPFSTDGPVLAVRAREDAPDRISAEATSQALTEFLVLAHEQLDHHPINTARRQRGALPLNTVVTKWNGLRSTVPALADHVGGTAALIASTGLYQGLARYLDASFVHVPEDRNTEQEVAAKVDAAVDHISRGTAFVYLHTKAADEAAHQRKPTAKRDAIAAIDRGLTKIVNDRELSRHTVVGVVADHATPSWGPLLHSGDAVPLVVRGPSVLIDDVFAYSERAAARGGLGTLTGRDVLAVLVNLAGRARFRGSRHAPCDTLAEPLDTPALRVPER